ncbi:MAG: HlyD family secretion protein, partial [Rhodanobacteraceae bacterium]
VAQIGARLAAARAGIAVARASLQSAHHRLAQHQLRAPIDAFVEQVHTQKGENASASSSPLFVLLPEVPHIIRAELNAGYAKAIHKGTSATVVLEDDNGGEAWPAHVVRVGRTLSPSKLDEDPTSRAIERTVSCVLAFDKPAGLRIGRRVLVRFLPDTGDPQ